MKKRLERLVCAEHCQYFRPWVNPEPGGECVAKLIGLMKHKAEVLDAIERLRHFTAPRALTHDNLFLYTVCPQCKHYPLNCAYRRPERSPSAAPCGGLIVLDQLLQRQVISLADLPTAPEEPYSYFE